ncbi:hypothetical protein CBR_g40012 [Chara braunii]|uniref:Uncharacterized protein n=1 Tax=Chara braunii TaxID=69332 RepID=A0A388LSY1_CHABU|nr:hypothetical protein CBR_g40012 [Chara braunii]|eukprot:GBG85369.1 hypothetical protein CBR_g40012 [Chara braunii]
MINTQTERRRRRRRRRLHCAEQSYGDASHREVASSNLCRWAILLCCCFFLAQPGLVSANGFTCRDRSLCRTFSRCSRRDALFRSGHLCHGFPSYIGGPPITRFHWDDETETYESVKTNGTVCVHWTTKEQSPGEIKVGSCQCKEMGHEHCKSWACLQDEADLCGFHSKFDCGSPVILADGTPVTTSCCYTNSDGYLVTTYRDIQKEWTSCTCKKTVQQLSSASASASAGGSSDSQKAMAEFGVSSDFRKAKTNYCVEWHCTERDITSTEEEDYVCKGFQETYCSNWEGSIEGTEEFEVSRCDCNFVGKTEEGLEYCSTWSCYEKGFDYHDPNLAWSAFGIVMASPLFFGSLVLLTHEDRHRAWWLLVTLPAWAGFMFVTTMMGGVGALLITLAFQLGLPVLMCMGSKARPDSVKSTAVTRKY